MLVLARGTRANIVRYRALGASCFTSQAPDSLVAFGERVLRTPEPLEKVALTLWCKALWDAGELPIWHGTKWVSNPPAQPARSARPPLFDPKELPNFKDLDTTVPIHILHALAHIELGAVDNYWDTLVRFDPDEHALPRAFYDDFLVVASDEARHFTMVDNRLRALGTDYGSLPATRALLAHATNTAADLAARIAVVPLVQEARGLDSGARLVHKLLSAGDRASAAVVEQIVWEERSHVAFGIKWFRHLCAHQQQKAGGALDSVAYFHELVLQYFPNGLPGPFDVQARLAADMDAAWYQPLESKVASSDAPVRRAATGSPAPLTSESQSERVAAFAASKRRVLVVGPVWPERTSSAAGVRSSDLIQILQEHGFQVLCVSPSRLNAHTEALARDFNVQCIQADANTDAFEKLLLAATPQLVLFDRFVAEEMYSWQVRQFAPTALRVLDLQDVHFVRKAREWLVTKRGVDVADTLDMHTLPVDAVEQLAIRELAAIHRSDLTLFVSDVERDVLVNRFQVDGDALHCCDFFYPSPAESDAAHKLGPAFAERQHVAFIGSFKHAPNVDAVEWLTRQILPHFRSVSAGTGARATVDTPEVHIYGSYADAARFRKLHDPSRGVRLMGFAPDAHDTLRQYRLTVAPLRFGAGIKGKIADSWHVGTPCVATSIGAEGMALRGAGAGDASAPGWGGAIADDPVSFASAMSALYANERQWTAAQAAGVAICRTRYDRERNAESLMERLEEALERRQAVREQNWVGRILWSEKFRATEYMSRFIRAKNALKKKDDGEAR